jgi:translation initiation factor 2-alpha kinase 4
MEYVEKLTLREAIEDGITEVDSWRLLVSHIRSNQSQALSHTARSAQFQILSAMLHFTSLK